MAAQGKDKEAHVLEEPRRPVEPPLLTGSEKIGPHGFEFDLRLNKVTKQYKTDTVYAILCNYQCW